MAVAPRSFALDFNRKKVYANSSVEVDYTFSSFYNGDIESLEIYIVRASTTGGRGALTQISPTGLSLKAAIGPLDTAETTYTSVTLTESGSTFIGSLPLNVAAIDALFASSAADRSVFLEFELSDGGAPHTIRFPITLAHQIITGTLQDAQAPDVSLGKQEAQGLYIPRVWPASFNFIATDSDGSGRQYVVYVQDGALRFDPIG